MVVQYVDLTSELQTLLYFNAKRGLESENHFMKKPVIGITGNEKTHPDDDIMMSYAAKALLKALKTLEGFPSSYRLVIKKWPATISV